MNVEEIRARLAAFPVLGLNAAAGLHQQAGTDTIICDPGDVMSIASVSTSRPANSLRANK
ncbi:hypothetical protein [Bradyrhizobium sp. AUGA SZCCT0274]|uniref:hypothetical protein n=1 Tax=unclassified Bradyrhizobium TaxID=2631580 RepID=UPI003908B918